AVCMAISPLLSALRRALRVRHYSPRTEEVYVQWVRRFIRACGTRHPRELGSGDVTRFLSDLAVDANVSASTQNQALAAILFLYRDVLEMPVGWLTALDRKSTRLNSSHDQISYAVFCLKKKKNN